MLTEQVQELEQPIMTGPGLKDLMLSCCEIYDARGGDSNEHLDSLAKFKKSFDIRDLRFGYLNEILFHTCLCLHHPFLRLDITNRNGDTHGVDFYIDGLPLDVTANLSPKKMGEDSYREADYCILFLPPCPSYTKPFKQNSEHFRGDDLYYKLFIKGEMDIKAYFEHIYTTNILILETIKDFKQTLDNPEISGNSQKKLILKARLGKELVDKISATDYFVFNQKIREVNRIFKIIEPSVLPSD